MLDDMQTLEFLDENFKWAPIVTGDRQTDYLYGYECAYRYSQWLTKMLIKDPSSEIIAANAAFRLSINLESPEGRGFMDGITGKVSRYEVANDL